MAGIDRLTPDQARKVHDALQPATGYLWRMLGRMDSTNLRLADPKLYCLIVAARDAMHALTVELHHQSCVRRLSADRPAPGLSLSPGLGGPHLRPGFR